MIDNIREHIDNKNRELEGMGEFKHIRKPLKDYP